MLGSFDFFLDDKYWYTRNGYEDDSFFCALERAVRDPDFDPDALARHIDDRRKDGVPAQANLTEDDYRNARDYYVAAAKTVKSYLQTVDCPETIST